MVVIADSFDTAGSCKRTATVDSDVMSSATNAGGSGGRACAKPNTSLFKIFALRPQVISCLSVSPPAQPVQYHYIIIINFINKHDMWEIDEKAHLSLSMLDKHCP